jgi:hypothetical protein
LESNGGVLLLVIGLSAGGLEQMGFGGLCRGNALVYAVNRALNPALHRIHPESRYSIAIVGFWLYSSLFAT